MLKTILVAGCIGLAFFVLTFVLSLFERIRLRKRFEGAYFNFEDPEQDYDRLQCIKKYWDMKQKFECPQYYVDDTTWNDLDLDYLFFKMNATQSSMGEEYLYARLRMVNLDPDQAKKFEEALNFFDQSKETKLQTLSALYSLGKDSYNALHEYIYKLSGKPIRNIYIYYILMCIPFLSAALCFFSPLGFVTLAVSLFINAAFYYKNKIKLELGLNSISYIQGLVNCAKRLSKLEYGTLSYGERLRHCLKGLDTITRNKLSFSGTVTNELETLFEYIKIVLMWDFIQYNRILSLLKKNAADFHELVKLVGEIDCVIALGAFRKSLPFYSAPEFAEGKEIVYEDVYHPFLKKPVPNSLNWDQNSIITGSNASGKSTFVKALAITTLCAQNLSLCFAKKYAAKPCFVISSMAVRDKLLDSESYFIAETKSLKRILDRLEDQVRVICFIDEILKGTNTIERIASSVSILSWLSQKNALAMVASHDMELTEILSGLYENFHFRETLDEGIHFDYKLHKGPATSRNAIKLLEFLGFDPIIVHAAESLAEGFEKNKKWDFKEK